MRSILKLVFDDQPGELLRLLGMIERRLFRIEALRTEPVATSGMTQVTVELSGTNTPHVLARQLAVREGVEAVTTTLLTANRSAIPQLRSADSTPTP